MGTKDTNEIEIASESEGVAGYRLFLSCQKEGEYSVVKYYWWSWGGNEERCSLEEAEKVFGKEIFEKAHQLAELHSNNQVQ